MSGGRRTPPRWLERVVAWLLGSSPWAESTVGDLAEGYHRMRGHRSTFASDLWYSLQVASVAVHRLASRDPDAPGTSAARPGGWNADLRWAVRSLVRRPLLSLTVVAVLALGLGANAAVFSVVDGTFRATEGWADEDRTLALWPGHTFSRGQLWVFRDDLGAFETVGAYRGEAFTVAMDGGTSSSVPGAWVSPDLFAALRVQPVLGRGFTAEDGEPGGASPVVVSHAFWTRELAEDPDVLGRRIEVNGAPRTIVGVQGRGGTTPAGTEIWLPVVLDPSDPDFFPDITYSFVGILRSGETASAGQETLRAFGRRLADMFPFFYRPDYLQDATVALAAAEQRALVRTPLVLLMIGTGLLLVVAALNVGNALLARAVERREELAVRRALGAGRGRLVRQLATESLLIGGLGAALALVVAGPAADALIRLFPADVAMARSDWTSAPVLLFIAVASALAWAVLAGVPIGVFLASDGRAIKDRIGARAPSRSGLLVVQTALATVLLVSAGLLVRSVSNLRDVPLGFSPEAVASAQLSPPAAYLEDVSRLRSVQDEIVRRAEALPEVSAAGMTSFLPLEELPPTQPVQAEDERIEVNEAIRADFFVTDAGFFGAMGITMEAGRLFGTTEDTGRPSGVIVNRALADRLWPGQDPVGRTLAFDPHAWDRFVPVIGVVEDFRVEGLIGPERPAIFVSRSEQPTRRTTLVVRASTGAEVVAPSLRRLVAETDGSVAVGRVRGLGDVVRDAYGSAWVTMGLLSSLAVLATLLAALGVNAALGNHVARSRREIAIRLTLGAGRAGEVRRVLESGLRPALLGVVVGSALAVGALRLLQALLFGVDGTSPGAWIIPGATVIVAASLAGLSPALRAGRTSPADILREG